MIHLPAWMHWRALTLTRRHKLLLGVHCRAKLSLQTAPSDPWTKTHSHTSTPVYPLWFSATRGIWWNSAQVSTLSRGLQRSSPHRQPRTSQILPRITPSFSIFPPLSMHSLWVWLSLWISLSLYLLLPLFIAFLPVHLFLLVRPASFIFLTLDLWALRPLERRGKQTEEKRRKKNCERMAVYWRGGKGNNADPWKIDKGPSLTGISGVGWSRGSYKMS